ncbi:hypothetical protein [Tessaracoccus sp. ZS01]|uniref:hypothetical protein n=1 Tax=Tessaracoccus sp. ZS01 TaxID=1906324 RepID=UPI00096C60BA|nr:hypothetical protein [Tessaracoccus sp. ZS01]MCG6566931.1 hypothetical protein [Tessaracoccus sp. ZS01]OMG58059.1 hypothetical protein BJN44_04720 [Tessaracoccus sp. ZS01]
MKFTRLAPAVAAVAAVGLLAGCSPTAGTALVVDGNRYTESEVTQIVDGCAEALQVAPDQLRRQGVVGTLLLGGLFDSFGAEISEEDLRAAGAQSAQGSEQLFSVEDCKPLALANVKTTMLGQLEPQFIEEAANNLDVQLNPRYGKWEPWTQQLLNTSGSLSEPVVAPQ